MTGHGNCVLLDGGNSGSVARVRGSKVSGVRGQINRVEGSAVGERLGVRNGGIIIVVKLSLSLPLNVPVACVGELLSVMLRESFVGRA